MKSIRNGLPVLIFVMAVLSTAAHAQTWEVQHADKLLFSSSGTTETKTISLISAALATGGWTYTLPDAGASASFALTTGAGGATIFTGPTATRTFTLPDATTTILTTNALVTVGQGGIGVGTLASNGVLYGNATGAVQALAVNGTATNKFLTQSTANSGLLTWNTIVSGDVPWASPGTIGSGTASTGAFTTLTSTTHTITGDVQFVTGSTRNINFSAISAGTGSTLQITGNQGAATSAGGPVTIAGGAGGGTSGNGGALSLNGGSVTSGTVGAVGINDANAGAVNIAATSGTGAVSIGNTTGSMTLKGSTIGVTTATASNATFTLGTSGAAIFSSSTANSDDIAILPQSTTNTNPFQGTITTADLTAARTYTFPDGGGTVSLSTNTDGYPALTTAESYLASDVTMTTVNTAYAGPSVSLTAGTWLITSEAEVDNVGATQNYFSATIILGTSATVAYTSGMATTRQPGASTNADVDISLSKIVTLASTTSVGIWAYSNLAACVLKATPPLNPHGTGTATAIHAVRIK